jgi:LytS/YehU family sensor histidine kinase
MRTMNALLKKIIFTPNSFWKLNLLAWLLFGLLCLLAQVYFASTLISALAQLLVNLALALILSAVLRAIYRRTQLTDFFGLRTLAIMATSSLAAAFLQSEIAQALVNHMEWGNPQLPRPIALSYRTEFAWIVFMSWSLGYYGLKAKLAAHEEMLRAKKSRSEARRMELQLLRNRLAPHFLFNSLNGIAAEISPHPVVASELVHDVSDYLRYLLDHRDEVLSPLSEEFDAMSSYLKIEQARFGERLHVALDATRSARRTLVPCFLLQPLVENAVKHATWPDESPLTIAIRSTKEKERLMILVSNTGTLHSDNHEGVGLSTLRRLLNLHYPGRHEFSLSNHDDTVHATLILHGTPCSAS